MHIEIDDIIYVIERPKMWCSGCSNNSPVADKSLQFPLVGRITRLRRKSKEYGECFALKVGYTEWGFSTEHTRMIPGHISNRITIL